MKTFFITIAVILFLICFYGLFLYVMSQQPKQLKSCEEIVSDCKMDCANDDDITFKGQLKTCLDKCQLKHDVYCLIK